MEKPPMQVKEVVKMLGDNKCLLKGQGDEKSIYEVHKNVDVKQLVPNARVAVGDGQKVEKILPKMNDPLVSLMKVEK